MDKIKIELTLNELQILNQCICSLNFEGKHVRTVGLLHDKILINLEKLNKNESDKKE